MPELRDAQIVELFHLAFLQVLQARLDQARYVLKGGANLRYFFDSVRYSEDIDLDTDGLAPSTLTEKVDGILGSSTIDAADQLCSQPQTSVRKRVRISWP